MVDSPVAASLAEEAEAGNNRYIHMEFKKIQSIAFFAVLIGCGILFYQMLEPYMYAIFWAAVMATIFYPIHRRIHHAVGQREHVSASISVGMVILVVLIPMAGVIGLVANEAVAMYEYLRNPENIEMIGQNIQSLADQPVVQDVVGDVNVNDELRNASSTIAGFGFQVLRTGSRSTVQVVIQTAVMIYTLFYFFKDGPRWLERIMKLLPFGDKNEMVLYQKFASTAKATLKGTILLGGIQGTIGGILFFVVGIPSAALWGLIMIVLSIIPAVGASLVWIPGAVYLAVTGQLWQAAVLVIGGILLGFVDNLLRPPLVGSDLQMHPVIILFTTIGGLAVFGISGVVIGPMIGAFFLALLDMYELKYRIQLQRNG